MKKIALLLITLLTTFLSQAQDVQSFVNHQLQTYPKSVRKEPGVICIFPNQVRADETKIRIVEIYRNKEAYQHHLTTPHFQAYKQGTLHMVKSLNLLDIQPLAPDAMQQIFIKLQ